MENLPSQEKSYSTPNKLKLHTLSLSKKNSAVFWRQSLYMVLMHFIGLLA